MNAHAWLVEEENGMTQPMAGQEGNHVPSELQANHAT